jgi:hypothetical protein
LRKYHNKKTVIARPTPTTRKNSKGCTPNGRLTYLEYRAGVEKAQEDIKNIDAAAKIRRSIYVG